MTIPVGQASEPITNKLEPGHYHMSLCRICTREAADGFTPSLPISPFDPNRGNLVRMYFRVSPGNAFTVPGPLRTKKSPSGAASIPFHFRNTGSGLRWQLTTQTVLPCTICVFGSMQVPARSPRPLRTTCARWRMNLSSLSSWSRSMPTIDAVVRHADQQVAALGVQERGDRLEDGVRHALVVLPILLEVPAQRRLELQRLRLAALDQLLGIAVARAGTGRRGSS